MRFSPRQVSLLLWCLGGMFLVVGCSLLVWACIAQPEATEPASDERKAFSGVGIAETTTHTLPSNDDFAQIFRRQFRPDWSPPAPAPKPTIAKAAPPPPLRAKLIGVFNRRGISKATFALPSGRHEFRTIGQSVGETGAEVVAINAGAVELRHQGQIITLDLAR